MGVQRIATLGIIAIGLAIGLVGCSDDSSDPALTPATAVSSAGAGGGGSAPSQLVEVLNSVPVFTASDVKDGRYAVGGSTGENLLTGFNVSAGTSVDDVLAFFKKELPLSGWQQEAEPSTEASEKSGPSTQTIIWSFIKDDVRLGILIPLTHKDAPPGITVVELILAPKEIKMFGGPVAIASSPPTPRVAP